MCVYDLENEKEYEKTIKEDDNGKYFTWNYNKIYLNDWIKIPMKELKEKIENGEHVTTSDLCQAIMSEGIENVRFLIPSIYLNSIMYDSFPVEEYTLFKIEERWNRSVKQCYKLILVPAKSDNSAPYL